MLEFDFRDFIANIKWRQWRMDRISGRASRIFSMDCLFGVTIGKSIPKVLRLTRRLRKQWALTLRELAARQLWAPTRNARCDPYAADFSEKQFTLSYKRCLNCRPAYAHYPSKTGDLIKIRSCWRCRICPFCWAGLAAAQYVAIKRALKVASKKHPKLVLTTRIVQQEVVATGWNPILGLSAEELVPHIHKLRAVILKQQEAHSKLARTKKLQRGTIGSLWRIVVVPSNTGWFVQTRQIFLCPAKDKLPAVRIRDGQVVHLKSVKVNVHSPDFVDECRDILLPFCAYPVSMVKGYSELTAVVLHASARLRLFSGTGVLVKTGRTYIKQMQQEAAYEKAKKAFKKARKETAARAADAAHLAPE